MIIYREEKVRQKILRIFKIWEQRSVYDDEFLSDLTGLLSAGAVKKTDDEALDFQVRLYYCNNWFICKQIHWINKFGLSCYYWWKTENGLFFCNNISSSWLRQSERVHITFEPVKRSDLLLFYIWRGIGTVYRQKVVIKILFLH